MTTAIRGTRAAAMGVRGAEAARAVAKAEEAIELTVKMKKKDGMPSSAPPRSRR